MNNPNFNLTEFSNIKNNAGVNGFVLSSKRWIERTNAIGIIAKAGRYNGGTFAHNSHVKKITDHIIIARTKSPVPEISKDVKI